jgi:outer membrane protein assembly factor BamD
MLPFRLPRHLTRRLLALCAPLALVGLAACADSESDAETYVERPPEVIYNQGLAQLRAGELEDAASQFNEVERQHPYSPYATQAQLLAAYSQYEALEYDEAIQTLDRFIELHPGNEDIAYAYYLRALSYYERIVDVERDQRITRLAADALQEVITRFPNTVYARDAQLKYDLTRDQLAGQEMSVGRFYLERGQLTAAINRFDNVVDEYDTTSHVPEALHRLTEAYLTLGLTGEAQRTASVLAANFPDSEWYRDSYALLVEGRTPPRVGLFEGAAEAVNPLNWF